MNDRVQTLASEGPFDLVVIGGGITGAANSASVESKGMDESDSFFSPWVVLLFRLVDSLFYTCFGNLSCR